MQEPLPPSIDPFAEHFATPPVLKALVDKARWAEAKAGFYRKTAKLIKVLDPTKAGLRRVDRQGDELVARILKKKDPPSG